MFVLRSRRLVAAMVAAALVTVVPAADAADEATPVAGSGNFLRAPVLSIGAYGDTLQTTETLYYAVRIPEGTGLKARVLLRRKGNDRVAGNAELRLRVYTPVRQDVPDVYAARRLDPGQDDFSAEVTAPAASSSTARDSDTPLPPGLYYLAVSLSDPSNTLGRREFESRIEISRTGGNADAVTLLVGLLALGGGAITGVRIDRRDAKIRQRRRERAKKAQRR